MTDPQAYWTPERKADLDALLDEMARYDDEKYAQAVLHLALLKWCDFEEVYALLPGYADMFAFGRIRDWGFKVRRRCVDGKTQYMIDVRRRSGRDSSGADPGVSGSGPGPPSGERVRAPCARSRGSACGRLGGIRFRDA